MSDEQKKVKLQIEKVKLQLMKIEQMRPGNLNQQFRKPKEKLGEYYQLNYTFRGKTKTEHVKKENLENIRAELAEYQKAKDLFLDWMELSIKLSKLKIKES